MLKNIKIPQKLILSREDKMQKLSLPDNIFDHNIYLNTSNMNSDKKSLSDILYDSFNTTHPELDHYSRLNFINLKNQTYYAHKPQGLVEAENIFNYLNEKTNNLLNNQKMSILYQGKSREIMVLNKTLNLNLKFLNGSPILDKVWLTLKFESCFFIVEPDNDSLSFKYIIQEENKEFIVKEFNEDELLSPYNS